MKKRATLYALFLAMAMMVLTVVPVFASEGNGTAVVNSAETGLSASAETTEPAATTTTPTTGSWKEASNGKYYWYWSDGTKITTTGWQTLNGYKYYLIDGARTSSWLEIDGKRYFFHANGKLLLDVGWKVYKERTFYFYKDHHVATGVKTIDGVMYYFSATGILQKNKRAVKYGNYYYNVDSKGVATRLSANEGKCILNAQAFIKKHTTAGNTKAEKLRQCFRYMVGHMAYTPGYYTWRGDKAYFETRDGLYKLANEMFTSYNLRGNCHRFAACFAACAKEFGYPAYVITTTGDHSFVKIYRKYYDNMGARFGSLTVPYSYNVYKKQKM